MAARAASGLAPRLDVDTDRRIAGGDDGDRTGVGERDLGHRLSGHHGDRPSVRSRRTARTAAPRRRRSPRRRADLGDHAPGPARGRRGTDAGRRVGEGQPARAAPLRSAARAVVSGTSVVAQRTTTAGTARPTRRPADSWVTPARGATNRAGASSSTSSSPRSSIWSARSGCTSRSARASATSTWLPSRSRQSCSSTARSAGQCGAAGQDPELVGDRHDEGAADAVAGAGPVEAFEVGATPAEQGRASPAGVREVDLLSHR